MSIRGRSYSIFSMFLDVFPSLVVCNDIDKHLGDLVGAWRLRNLENIGKDLYRLRVMIWEDEYYLLEDLVSWVSEHCLPEEVAHWLSKHFAIDERGIQACY